MGMVELESLRPVELTDEVRAFWSCCCELLMELELDVLEVELSGGAAGLAGLMNWW